MKTTLTLMALLLLTTVFGQVGEVKERARNFKSGDSSGSSDSWSSSSGGDGAADVFFVEAALFLLRIPIEGMIRGQEYQLNLRHDEPWRVSFETHVLGGFDPSEQVTLLAPTVRGNWGLFSTQVRYNRIFDLTGTLSTWDWQVLQFNFVNNESVRLVGGLGLSHEVEINQTHFEGLGELSVFALERRLVPTVIYRWSGNGRPRKDFSALVEYRPRGHLDGPMASFQLGYQHQNWYGVQFNFVRAGIGIILR